MADLEKLVIELQLKTQNLESGLAQAQSKIKNFGREAELSGGGVNKLKGNVNGLVGSFAKFAGLAAIGAFLVSSSKAAAEDAESFASMAGAIKNVTGESDKNIAGIDKQIQALSEMSGVVDDDIRPAFASLVRSTGSTTKAMQLQKLALDLAAGAHVPVAVAAKALGRAVNGNTGALVKLDPALKNSKNMLGDLQKQMHGAAQTAADANPYGRMKVALDNVKESMGKALLPIIKVFSQLLIKLSPIISLIAGVIGKVVTAFMPFISQLMDALMPVLGVIIDAFMQLVTAVMPPLTEIMNLVVIPAVKLLAKILSGQTIPMIMGLIQAIMPLVSILADELGVWLNIIIQVMDKLFDAMQPVVKFISGFMMDAFKKLSDFLGPLWNNILKPMLEGMAKLLGIKIDTKATATVKVSADAKDLNKQIAGSLDKSLLNVTSGGKAAKATTGSKAKSGGHTINTTINANTNASPKQIANNVVNAIKFNIPLAGTNTGGFSGMASQVATG